MKEIQASVKITVKEDGETLTEVRRSGSVPVSTEDYGRDVAAGQTICADRGKEMTEEEAERYAVASDLANVCEYLEDSEVIRIKLIIRKAQARKEREEKE